MKNMHISITMRKLGVFNMMSFEKILRTMVIKVGCQQGCFGDLPRD